MQEQTSTTTRLKRLLPWIYLVLLAGTNIYICQAAFLAGSNPHWNSIHGQWISLARLGAFDWLKAAWWPYWGGGAPLEFTYAPLVPAGIAALHRLFSLSPALALNVLTASVYCLGPVAFYLLSWRLSRLPGYSFAAALACSLASPIALLMPDHEFLVSFAWGPRRLHLAFEWDDLPHLISLTLLPLAVWSLARALRYRRLADYAITSLTMAAMMLANMFGVVLAAFVAITVPLALIRRSEPLLVRAVIMRAMLLRAMLTVAAGYLLACPWVPPSLLMTIRSNAKRNGEGASSVQFVLGFLLVALALWIVWRLSTRYAEHWGTRWMCLFGCAVLVIPALSQYAGLQFLPQPGRYKIEADLVIVWMVVFALRPLIDRVSPRVRIAFAFPLFFLVGEQIVSFELVAREITRPVDVERSIEYRSSKWVAENLPGQRVMMGGSLGNFLNAFTRMDQLSAQPYTTAPNWEERVGVYTIYVGENAGERDGAFALLWLKAFGVQAVAVPGPHSAEYWKPFARPKKFDGMLDVLWHEDDTTIYRVPQRSASLAHVMRPEQLVRHPPIHGLDTGELQTFVTALDSESRPAVLEWRDVNHARIRALLALGEIVSTQITYHPGWHATVNGTDRPVHTDGIGLMAIDSHCPGNCEIELTYDGGWESRLCRAASGGTLLLLLAAGVFRYRAARRDPKENAPDALAARSTA